MRHGRAAPPAAAPPAPPSPARPASGPRRRRRRRARTPAGRPAGWRGGCAAARRSSRLAISAPAASDTSSGDRCRRAPTSARREAQRPEEQRQLPRSPGAGRRARHRQQRTPPPPSRTAPSPPRPAAPPRSKPAAEAGACVRPAASAKATITNRSPMMTSAIRNSVNGPRAAVSWTMAMVTVGEKDTTTVEISALTASACGQRHRTR